MQSDKAREDILRRLKSVEGHVRGIQRMVEEGQYCIDIINQALAVQAALDKVNTLVLERHLQTCVATAIKSDDRTERERVIGELLQVFQGRSQLGRARLAHAEEIDLSLAGEPNGAACQGSGHRSGGGE